MKPLYFFTFLLTSLVAEAQRLEQYYDWNWKRTELANARFVAVIEKKDSLWLRSDFFIHENLLQMSGSYTDSSCKVAHGSFRYYHANGIPQHIGEYVNGKKNGIWVSYHSNGMLSDSGVYNNGNITGTAFSFHPNGYLSDSALYNPDGSGVSVAWFDNGSPAAAGRYSAGYKKHGKWQYFHKNGNPASAEVYEDGKLVNKQYFDEAGNAMADTTGRDKEALFKGGLQGWQKFILRQLYFPGQYKIINADKAVVVVDAVIDEDGNMTGVEVYTSFHKEFDKIAVNALQKSPRWTPAIAHNRRVKYRIRQAVTFQQETE